MQRAQRVTDMWSVTLTRPNRHTLLARVCFVALVLRCLCVLAIGPKPAWDGIIYERAAEQLAHGEGYTQRILDVTAPARATAFFPPGFPAVLSLLHRVAHGRQLDLWFQIAMSMLLVPAAWLFGRRLGGVRAGQIAAWLTALWPGGVLLSASWFTEPLFAVLLSTALLMLLYARQRDRKRALLGAALLLGLAAYVRPTALAIVPFTGAAVGYLAERARGRSARWRAALTWAVLGTGTACLPLSPWIVRNQIELHAPVLVSTNAGFNLLLGTVGEGSYGPVPEGVDCPGGVPEVARDRCRMSHAFARIRHDPTIWLARAVLKALHTFGHESAPAQLLADATERWSLLALALTRMFWLPFIALALLGGFYAWGQPHLRAALCLVLAPVVGTLLLHSVFIGGDRYHVPLVPIFAGLAGYCATLLWPRKRSRQVPG